MTLDEAGAYAYATEYAAVGGVLTASINGYAIGSGSFVPLPRSPYTFAAQVSSPPFYVPELLQTAPGNRFLYGIFGASELGVPYAVLGIVIKNADGTLGGFAVGSPVSSYSCAGQAPAVGTEPTQTFVFAECGGGIESSSIDPSTGAITATFPPFIVPVVPLAVDPSGKWLLATGIGLVDVLSIDPTTGSLMEMSNHQFPVNGDHMVLDHTGRFLYVTNSGNNSITAYSFDAGTGVLTPIQGATYATAQVPVAVTVAQP